MNTHILRYPLGIFLLIFTSLHTIAQPSDKELSAEIGNMLTRIAEREVSRCPVKVEGLHYHKGRLRISTSIGMSYYPFRESSVAMIYDSVRSLLPQKYSRSKIEIVSDGQPIENLIPLAFRSKARSVKPFTNSGDGPQIVRRVSHPHTPRAGLAGRHIALWQSHGRYFDVKQNEWSWQRSLLWQTVEDLYTQSYVLPFLVPMLENAGATVLLPRERDFQRVELIADNDKGVDSLSTYSETNGLYAWESRSTGFAHTKQTYLSGENPFAEGTSRTVRCVQSERDGSAASWGVNIPVTDDYAVYVSYQSTKENAVDASYTVTHAGGKSRFKVNQRMGGGTWIYLGTFRLLEGNNRCVVTLSNVSASKGAIVSADAIKIGGGMGNIARQPKAEMQTAEVDYSPITSGMPRYCEGSRYWLQWAGYNTAVYNIFGDGDDYKDDYRSRGEWVNALMGGSAKLPKAEGKGIPLDLSIAFHTDAGITEDDRTIGTLGIFYTKTETGRFEGKVSRYRSRDLTDMVMTQIVGDIRKTFDVDWSRRGLWNRSYFEARVPSVPAMLLELLSHQNLADIRLGHDPAFKFVVARAIYKAILRHVATQYGTAYCVAPLPVESFSATFEGNDIRLNWSPVVDSLEPTAKAERYILYTREGDGGFDNGTIVDKNTIVVSPKEDIATSYRITAINRGGESFPSETLTICRSSKERGRVMLINGFDRVSAPAYDDTGFHNTIDSGVAYLKDVAFIGEQYVFDTSKQRERNDRDALGASFIDHEGEIVGGNTFDYPALYAHTLLSEGWSFVSSSAKAVERAEVDLLQYDVVGLILGKQRRTTSVDMPSRYACFTEPLKQALQRYTKSGGKLFASGAYIASDLLGSKQSTANDKTFANKVLHINLVKNAPTHQGKAKVCRRTSPMQLSDDEYRLTNFYTPDCYTVNSVDGLSAVGDNSWSVLKYTDSGMTAAVCAVDGDARTFVAGFPIESICDTDCRNRLIIDIMKFLKPDK